MLLIDNFVGVFFLTGRVFLDSWREELILILHPPMGSEPPVGLWSPVGVGLGGVGILVELLHVVGEASVGVGLQLGLEELFSH